MYEVARVLYGSQNLGLSGPDSDKDYKVLLCPTYKDLYNSHKVEKGDLANFDHEHYSPIDVRQFNKLVLKCNPNILEALFSVEWDYTDKRLETYVKCAQMLLRQGYLALYWKEFYAAMTGLVLNSLKRYGETNPKSVSRACYLFNLTNYLVANDFSLDYLTWRNNFYSDYSRDIRFNSDAYDLQAISGSVKYHLEDKKEEFQRRADSWCYDHNSGNDYLVDTLNMKAANLNKLMYDFVKARMQEEFNK